MNRAKKIGVIPFLIGIYFSFYAVSPGILSKEIASAVKMGLLALIILAMVFKSETKNSYPKYIKKLIPCFVFYFLINIVLWGSSDIIRWAINVTAFFVFYKFCDYRCFLSLKYSLKIATLICTLSVLYLAIKHHQLYYFRSETLIDKSFLTAFYALTYFFCIIDIMYDRQKLFNIITLVIFIVANVFIVQSKTSLFALAIELTAIYVLFPNIRSICNKYIKYAVIIGAIAFFLIPYITLPEELTYGINRVLGFELIDQSNFTRQEVRLAYTFDVRKDIRGYCYDLFCNHPIFGIGQGNFKVINNHSANYFSDLIETESSWLQILTEGGIYYLLTMLLFFLMPIKDAIKIIYSENESGYTYYYLMVFSFFLVYAVIFLFNDFTDSLFWLSAGIMTSLMACDKNEVPPVHNDYLWTVVKS